MASIHDRYQTTNILFVNVGSEFMNHTQQSSELHIPTYLNVFKYRDLYN